TERAGTLPHGLGRSRSARTTSVRPAANRLGAAGGPCSRQALTAAARPGFHAAPCCCGRGGSPAFLRLACRSLAVTRVARDPGVLWRLAEGVSVTRNGLGVRIVQCLSVVFAAHPEVGKMVQEAAKDCVAVLSVRERVEDVLMPDLVDEL